MEPIVRINQIVRNDETTMKFEITVEQGAENITSEDSLRDSLKGTIPYQKGIIEVYRLSDNIWEIETNK